MKKNRASGYMLLEILVAITVTMIAASAVYAAFRLGIDVNRRIRDRSGANQNARLALRQISRDLRCAYFSNANEGTRFVGSRKQDGDYLSFTTCGPGRLSKLGCLQRVEYFVDTDPATPEQGLVRVSAGFPSRITPDETAGPRVEIAPSVGALRCAYFDGQSWCENWDSVENGLPGAIRVTMTVVMDEKTGSETTIQTSVPVFAGGKH